MMTEQEVHPSQIEDQLVQIWDSLQGKNKMRACLFNLVIYSKKDARQSYLQSVAKRVVKRFPCRIIFVTEDSSVKGSRVRSTVSVMIADEGEKALYCDYIQIEMLGGESEKTPFLVLPHLLPDLPIYIVWGDDPAHHQDLLIQLEGLASKTIFDSECSSCLREFASEIFYHRKQTESDIIDLNWARIEGWRNLLASIFYSKDKLDFLDRADHICITYNSITSDQFQKVKIQATYLQAWIASSLRWTFKEQKEDRFFYESHGKQICIELVGTPFDAIKPGRVTALAIQGENEEFHFARQKNQPYMIDIRHSTSTLCETPAQYLFDKEESGQSLAAEIFHRGTSKHFLQTLKYIEQGVCSDD